MRPTALCFYDHDRQSYAASVPVRDGDHEFMIGGYSDPGGVDERGEFAIVLHRFSGRGGLSAQLRVFDDAFGALWEAMGLGLLTELEEASLLTPDDLTRVLVGLGMRDRSHCPVAS